ncbi:MAG: ABC transporter permease [Clostridia bacterium]|nr:ABC transporter permease [Clostridia bacterium]
MKTLRFSRKHLGIPYALFLALFVVFPLLLIILYAFTKVDPNGYITLSGVKVSITFENFIEFFSKSSNIRVLFISFGLAIVTTALCLVISYPLAYILAKSKLNKNGVLLLLFILPMWINFVLRTAAMKELLFAIGMYSTNRLSFVNTVIGMVYDYLPFTIMPLYTVMIKLDKSLIEASADLGAKPASTFLRVTLPLTVPGIVSAVTMVLLPTTTSYVVSDTLGNGNVTIIGKVIESQFSTVFNWHAGSAIAMVLLVIIFITMWVTNKFTDDDGGSARGNGLW